MFKSAWASRSSWLPGVTLAVAVLAVLAFVTDGPTILFRYVF